MRKPHPSPVALRRSFQPNWRARRIDSGSGLRVVRPSSSCISEIPKFNRIHDDYQGKDVQVVGITVMSPHDQIKPKANEFGMKYMVLVGDDEVVDGFGGVLGWPTTFVVTKDWKIYKKYIGALPDKEARIKQDIEKLLGSS
jgi:peroxiredoxin